MALAQADVGLAPGRAMVVAIVCRCGLASDDPAPCFRSSSSIRAAYRKMRQNLWWAAGYNLISVPLAAGVLGASRLRCAAGMSVGAILVTLDHRGGVNAQLCGGSI